MTESPFVRRPLVMNTPQQGARLSSPPRVSPPIPSKFKNGDLVEVAARTWPGINKQGGMGRISRVHIDGMKVLYDVSYILGGSERRVEEKFIRVGSLETGHRVPKERDFFFNYTQEKPKTPAPFSSSKKSSLQSSSARRSESGSVKRLSRSSSSQRDSDRRATRRLKRRREAYENNKSEEEDDDLDASNNSDSSSTSDSNASSDDGPVSRRTRIIEKGTVLRFDKASDEENESKNGDSSSSSESESPDSDNDSEPSKEATTVKSVPSRSATPASQLQKENAPSQSTTTPVINEEKPKLERTVSSSMQIQRKGGRKPLNKGRFLGTGPSSAGEVSGASDLPPLPLNRAISAASVQAKSSSSDAAVVESTESGLVINTTKQSVEVPSPSTPSSYPDHFHDPFKTMQTNASWKPFMNMPVAPVPSTAINSLLNEQAVARHRLTVEFRLESDRLFLLFQLELKKATNEMWFRPMWSQMAKHPMVTASEIHRELIARFEKLRDDMLRKQQMQARTLYSMQMLAFTHKFLFAPNAAQVPMVVPLFPYSFI